VSYDFTFTTRCDSKKLKRFREWCSTGGKEYQDVLREVIDAGPEDRLKITPEEGQKKTLQELYK